MSNAPCLIQDLAIAIETTRKMLTVLQCSMVGVIIAALTLGAVRCPAQQLTNGNLFVTVNRRYIKSVTARIFEAITCGDGADS